MSDIVSVGHGYVNESDGSCTTDLLIAKIAREAYAKGKSEHKSHEDRQFYLGVCLATIIWVALTLLARWL